VGLDNSEATNSAGVGYPIVTTDGGATWTAGSRTAVGAAVSCPGTHVCVSVGAKWPTASSAPPTGDAFPSTDGGATWPPMAIASPEPLFSVACRSSTSCVAVGGSFPAETQGAILTYGT
jgi:hypothetical protein